MGDSDLGHDHDLLTGQIQLLDRLAEYDLREPIGVNLAPADRTSEFISPIKNKLKSVTTVPKARENEKKFAVSTNSSGAHVGRVEGLDAIFVTEAN